MDEEQQRLSEGEEFAGDPLLLLFIQAFLSSCGWVSEWWVDG